MSSSVPPTSKDRPRDDRPLSRVSESISRITSLQKEALERLVNRTHICGVLPTRFDIWTVAGVHGAYTGLMGLLLFYTSYISDGLCGSEVHSRCQFIATDR